MDAINLTLACLFAQVFPRTSTIHPGIFRGWALSSDSVSPRTNTIASRDQFKPMRIGENLVVNYNISQLVPLNAWVTLKIEFENIVKLVLLAFS